ncbi:MAG: carboxy terminal-processing peptidase [Pseudomonadales bacterium]|nr:carboxy terminal-processing peptidase [Pseudomonadales bacterium]MDP7359475.1 carboxy terminal-processing peptidase [Pseudomonadales bacterium]MDP7595405.1 carboxy terminal-processing peptidase [Pseudomonadales bacterium]
MSYLQDDAVPSGIAVTILKRAEKSTMKPSRQLVPAMLGVLSFTVVHLTYATLTTETQPSELSPKPVHITTTRNIVDALASRHYVKSPLNDALSSKIYDSYLSDLDPTKSYLLDSDVQQFEIHRYLMDNSLKRGDLESAFKIFNRYHQRVIDRFTKNIQLLEAGLDQFDFSITESLSLDRDDTPWASSQIELDELWRKRLKHDVLNLKLTDKSDEKIHELLLKRYRNRLARTKQTNSEDVYQLYMNSFTGTYDPHTQYFSPRTSENFNINMSLSLEGIGAVLQREDEYTKVVSLVSAGPADKSEMLHPGDKIQAVGQGVDGEMVDVIGWRLDEVVQLIRGKKDTVVRLDIIPTDTKDTANSKIIQITRNTVKLEEQSAQSDIIEVEQFGHLHKIGVIDIPTFYIDFQALQQGDKNFKSTTRDVRRLLKDLMQEGVDGVVIDLRDNGGGSLQEANSLTGLFIDRGPTVQIRGKRDLVNVLSDQDPFTTYDGPLVVLVNRLSASASEIFAGAIQDYQRGIIIGSQTFGKGTVQSLIPLNRGQLKLTQAKFYRISGESTQHQGVIPDIFYPARYDSESIGESTLDEPLPWDSIPPAEFSIKANVSTYVPELRDRHQDRIEENAEFDYLSGALVYRKNRSKEKSITLNQVARIKRKEEADSFWVALENKRRVAKGLTELTSLDELSPAHEVAANETPASGITPPSENDETGEANQLEGNELAVLTDVETQQQEPVEDNKTEPKEDDKEEPDPLLVESGNILADLINLSSSTAAEKTPGQPI